MAELIAGQKPHINYNLIPGVVYTWPEVAGVGATEQELKQKGIEYKVGKFPFLALGRAKASNENNGLIKVLADKKTDKILGVHIMGPNAGEMIAEGRKLADIAPNIVVKVPLTWDGLKTCKVLSADGLKVNVTLCFSANQVLIAAKAGATFISPFIGRLDDINLDGLDLISDIRTIYDNYDYRTEILAASIRSANHVSQCALIGADVVTAPPAVIKALASHPLTDRGLEQFMADWAKTGQKIL